MDTRRMATVAVALLFGVAAGYGVSSHSGIQPGYFEKQEAPAYGVSKETRLGSELGKEFEEHFEGLYRGP
jgi:hypothetical protein